MLDLDELVDAYWDVVAPAMRSDGLPPDTERPTHGWLSAYGFRSLIYALREYHDRTFDEFWRDDLELKEATTDTTRARVMRHRSGCSKCISKAAVSG